MVGFGGVFDVGKGAVVFPEVGVTAILVEGLGWNGGGCGFGGRGRGRGFFGRRRQFWRGMRLRRGCSVFHRRFFFEKVPQTGVEVAEGVVVGILIFAFAPEPAHWRKSSAKGGPRMCLRRSFMQSKYTK